MAGRSGLAGGPFTGSGTILAWPAKAKGRGMKTRNGFLFSQSTITHSRLSQSDVLTFQWALAPLRSPGGGEQLSSTWKSANPVGVHRAHLPVLQSCTHTQNRGVLFFQGSPYLARPATRDRSRYFPPTAQRAAMELCCHRQTAALPIVFYHTDTGPRRVANLNTWTTSLLVSGVDRRMLISSLNSDTQLRGWPLGRPPFKLSQAGRRLRQVTKCLCLSQGRGRQRVGLFVPIPMLSLDTAGHSPPTIVCSARHPSSSVCNVTGDRAARPGRRINGEGHPLATWERVRDIDSTRPDTRKP